jgi:hypothetical protein
MNASATGSPQQARALEHLDVFGDSLERHVERRGKLRHRLLLPRDPAQYLAPRRVRERPKHVIEVVGPGFNH